MFTDAGQGDYTPMFLSEIPEEFESGRTTIDVALMRQRMKS